MPFAASLIICFQIILFCEHFVFSSAFVPYYPSLSQARQDAPKTLNTRNSNGFNERNYFPTNEGQRPGMSKHVMQASLGPKSPFDADSFQLPSEKVMDAVEKAGGRVTFTDVAATAGIDLYEAQKGVVLLASMTQATLQVTDDGEIVYDFPKDFRAVLRNQSNLQRLRETYNQIQPVLAYLVRVGFGALLFFSLFVVFSSIILIQTSSSSDDDRRDERRSPSYGGGFGGMNYWLGPSPFDFFYYRPYYGYYYDEYYGRSSRPEDMGFLQAIFSYVFGDGDPNAGFEEQRMQTIAQVIRLNGCAVVAEQLAPYLDAPPPKKDQEFNPNIQESYMLPVLTRFNGVPEVTAEGEIIYVFPELQTSALESLDPALQGLETKPAAQLKGIMMERQIPFSDVFEKSALIQRIQDWSKKQPASSFNSQVPAFLQEQTNKFSVAGSFKLIGAGILGAANLIGVLYLGTLFSQVGAAQLPGIVGFAQKFYGVLVAYAVAFNAFPAWRYFSLQNKNADIETRNRSRGKYAEALMSASSILQEKLNSASKYRKSVKIIDKSEITYSTDQDIADQKEASKQSGDDLADFDKRLNSK